VAIAHLMIGTAASQLHAARLLRSCSDENASCSRQNRDVRETDSGPDVSSHDVEEIFGSRSFKKFGPVSERVDQRVRTFSFRARQLYPYSPIGCDAAPGLTIWPHPAVSAL
jgi:hypothetical protein